MPHLAGHWTLDFGLCHDLGVVGLGPHGPPCLAGSDRRGVICWGFCPPLPLSLPPHVHVCTHTFSQINKSKQTNKKTLREENGDYQRNKESTEYQGPNIVPGTYVAIQLMGLIVKIKLMYVFKLTIYHIVC